MYKLLLPIRYLIKRRITLLAIASIALSVFVVVVVMSVHTGLVVNFKEKNHNFVGDCIVGTDSLVGFTYYDEFAAKLKEQEFIEATSTIIKTFGLLTQPGVSKDLKVEIMGIDLADHCRVTTFGKGLYYHRDDPLNAFVPDYAPQSPGCVIGIIKVYGATGTSGKYYHDNYTRGLSFKIGCFPLTAKGALARKATDLVNKKTFRFSDDHHSGLVKPDSSMVYLPFDQAQNLCEMAGSQKRASAIFIKFARGVNLNEGTEKVTQMWADFVKTKTDSPYQNLLAGVTVQSWPAYYREVIAPMEKEQLMLTLLFIMLGFITVFIIFVVFYMIISHKSKDIGILKSIGVSSPAIAQLFLIFAAIVGAIGSVIGTVAGCIFLIKINDMEDWLFQRYDWQLWDRSVYAIGKIPNNIDWRMITIIICCAIAACIIGVLIPSMQAARRRPAEILQVNQL